MAVNPQIKTLDLRPPKAPNLPIAPVDYGQRYQDQVLNALRLYFNEIDNFGFGLINTSGGGGLSFPHLAAVDTTDQFATATNTATIVNWNTLESNSGFTLTAPGTATAEVSGVYKFTYSIQFVNTDNVIHDADLWLQVNGVDVPYSSTLFSIPARKSAGVFSYVRGYSEVTFEVTAGDEIELYWATNQAYVVSPATDGVYLEHKNAQTSPYARPITPSAIGSITFVSRLPTNI